MTTRSAPLRPARVHRAHQFGAPDAGSVLEAAGGADRVPRDADRRHLGERRDGAVHAPRVPGAGPGHLALHQLPRRLVQRDDGVYDTMQFVSCEVETICLGQAASAAAVLLAAGTPGKRFALPGARVLIHQPSFSEPVQGQASDLAIQADELMRTRGQLEEMLARHTGQSRERIGADIERDKILDAQAALEYGLIDRIVPSRKLRPDAPGAR